MVKCVRVCVGVCACMLVSNSIKWRRLRCFIHCDFKFHRENNFKEIYRMAGEQLPVWYVNALHDYLGLAPAGGDAVAPGQVVPPQVAPPGVDAAAPGQAVVQEDAVASVNIPEVDFNAIDWKPLSPWRNVLDALEEEGQVEDEFCLDGLFSPWIVEEEQEAMEDARGCEILDECLLPCSPQSQGDLPELGIIPELDGMDWGAESGLGLEPSIQSNAAPAMTGKIYIFIVQ